MPPDENDFGFTPIVPESPPTDESEEDYGFTPVDQQNKKTKSSFAQDLASGPIGQALLGGLKGATWTADALKLAMIGEALGDLDEIEEVHKREGKPFNREQYVQKLYKTAESFPTQQLAEDIIKEQSGLDLSPQDKLGKLIRRGAEIFSFQPGSILGSTGKELGKKAGSAAAGSTLAQGLEDTGVPQPISELAGFATGSGLSGGKFVENTLSKEGQEAKSIAQHHGLRRVRGAEEESTSSSVISPKRQAKVSKELDESSRKAIDDIINQKLPVKAQRDAGVNLEDAYVSAYDTAEKTAKSVDAAIKSKKRVPIKFGTLTRFIDHKIGRLKAKAPSMSDSDKILMDTLIKERSQMQNKTATASQVLQQYKNFNDNVSSIYKKPQFTGAESKIKDAYAQLNQQLIKSLENGGEKELANELRFANKIFSETQKLNQVESILGKAFDNGYDPKKLATTLGGKSNSAFLERSLGKEAVEDMRDIAKYGQRAHKMVLSQLKKNPSYLEGLTPLKASLLFLSHSKLPFATTAVEAIKDTLPRIQGVLLTRKTTSKAYKGFLKAAASPDSAAYKKASEILTKAIIDEFGSEEELVDFAKESKD